MISQDAPLHEQDARRIDTPQPGLYKRRLVKDGPWVPCRLALEPPLDPLTGEEMDRSWRLVAYEAGERHDDPDLVADIWCYGEPCPSEDYEHLIELREWALAHAPHAPEANYRRPVDLRKLPPMF